MNTKGYCGIGIWHPKHEINQGTLWRTAMAFGTDFVFAVGRRFSRQASDTCQTWKNVPMFEYRDLEDLIDHLPYDCPLVGVELGEESTPLDRFVHPVRACYLLGAEDHGLSREVLARCHKVVQIPGAKHCLNVALTGGIVLYDRFTQKNGTKTAKREEA